jgi:biotin carboxyl carrier protein
MPALLPSESDLEYKLNISGQTYSVETTRPDETGFFVAALNATEKQVVAHSVSREQLQLRLDDQSLNLFLAETIDGTWFWVEGRARFVQNADRQQRRTSRRPGGIQGQVTPPTPATVMRILVEVGARVEPGDALVVVSAMKMEITLTAPYAGTVTAIKTEVAAKVSPGEILVEVEPEPEEPINE